MNAKLVYGRIVEINDNSITVVVANDTGGHERMVFPLGIEELDEQWVASNLGKEFSLVVIDGKVMGFQD